MIAPLSLSRASRRVLVAIAAFAAVGLSTACGSGGGGGSGVRLTGATQGSAGPSTPTGPTFGAPAAPMVFALVTSDDAGRTPTTQSISGLHVVTAGALVQAPDNTSTAGMAHQIFTDSGFAASPDGRFLFVGHNHTNAVEALRARTDGSLVSAPGGTIAVGQAATIVHHPSLDVIYATDTSASTATSRIQAIGHDTVTGALLALGSVDTAPSLRGIAVDPSGRFLAAAHMFGSGIGVATYLLDTQGLPLPAPADRKALVSVGRPSGVAFDRTGRFLYVRDLDRGLYAFSVGATGIITALASGAAVATGGLCSDLVASPAHDLVFALTAFTSQVRPFRILGTGALQALPALALGDDCQHLAISADGLALYATSRTASRVRAYAVDPVSGAVTELASSPTSVVNPAGVTGAVLVVD